MAQPLTDAIHALTRYANEVTGQSDTTLSDAVETLVEGYGQGGGGGGVLKWVAHTTTQIPMFKGEFPEIDEIIVDMNDIATTVPTCGYISLATANAKISYINVLPNTTHGSDFFRQAGTFSEIDLGGISPTSMTRWFYQMSYSANGVVHQGDITIRNLNLDRLANVSSSFNNQPSGTQFDVYCTGELMNSISMNIATWTDASLNRLIDCLHDYSGGDAHTLTLGTATVARISSEKVALATAKNWSLA